VNIKLSTTYRNKHYQYIVIQIYAKFPSKSCLFLLMAHVFVFTAVTVATEDQSSI